ncbi:MAG: hypothetical protein SynsKO_04490 [Synoicihabitans sp.]
MGIVIFADTTFLIDLQRSQRNPHYLNALEWLESNLDFEVKISAIVWGEFLEGVGDLNRPIVTKFRSEFELISISRKVSETYGRLSGELRQRGRPIGPNDTWIAATALAHDAPLLTRNVAHFTRVPGLRVINYA